MAIYYSFKTKPYAQKLRCKATSQENHLWYDFLRDYPTQFRRQKQFGTYIVDFYCAKARLVVELDGSQHYTDDGLNHDANRTEVLAGYRLEVLRFTNLEIDKNFEGVCCAIDLKVNERLKELALLGKN